MLPTLNPPPPPWAWVTFPAAFQLPRHSECQQPDPRSSMRHFRTFPSPGITAEDSPVSKSHCFAHETTSEDPSVSRTRCLAHETTSEGPSVSRTRRSAHETTSEGPSVSRTRRSVHENDSEDPPVSRMRRLAHETTLADSFVSRTRRLAHETTSEGHSVSRTRRLAHETTSEGHSVSRTRRLAHETTSEDPSREQNAPSRSRDNFGRHRQAPSCTNPISWPLWYTRQASPVPILSPGHFGTPDKPLLYQKLSHSLFRITFFLKICFELFV